MEDSETNPQTPFSHEPPTSNHFCCSLPNCKCNTLLYCLAAFLVLIILSGVTYLYLTRYQPPATSTTTTKTEAIPTPTLTADPTTNWKTYVNTSHAYQIKYPDLFVLNICSQTNCLNPDDQISINNGQIDIGIEYAKQWSLCANNTLPCTKVDNIMLGFLNMKSDLETYYSEDKKKYIFRISPDHPNNDQIDIFGEFPKIEDVNIINQIFSTFTFFVQPTITIQPNNVLCKSCPQFTPPNPDWCKYGQELPPEKSWRTEDGKPCFCYGPPRCSTTPSPTSNN